MITFDFDRLRGIGLTPEIVRRAHASALADDEAAFALVRVARCTARRCSFHDGERERGARAYCRGSCAAASTPAPSLAVGDWVLAASDGGEAWVHDRIEPISHIARRDGDGSRHPIVSNVDRALIVMGLDDDFSPRRLERYLSLVHASGVAPLVVLSKADLPRATRRGATSASPGCGSGRAAGRRGRRDRRHRCASAAQFAHVTGFGATRRRPRLVGGRQVDPHQHAPRPATFRTPARCARTTAAACTRRRCARCIGCTAAHASSIRRGCGRSARMPTRTLWLASFADVASLATRCRFRDCSHGAEPGCAVRDGVDPDRVRNFQKLLRENRP
jgi:ribosome biogenesis GTPase